MSAGRPSARPAPGAPCLGLLRALASGLVLALAACGGGDGPAAPSITLASTTSPRDSGLLAAILPRFEERTGIAVRVVAVGTGRALALGARGDADVLLVHDPESERRFVEEGHGLARHPVMVNDFVIVGPRADPAGVRGAGSAPEALARIAEAAAPFVSRGDDSGTHEAERRLWRSAGRRPPDARASWYHETGSGMGATLNVATEKAAYTLVDRGTWLSFRTREPLVRLFEGDPALRNPYSAIVVDPARHPHAQAKRAQTFVDWLRSREAREAIASFRVDGRVLFHPAPRHGREAP